jgi:GDPmannose 4,6-dehydratase
LDWREYVVLDPALVRPAEVDLLVADPARAHKELGWHPTVNFTELVRGMVDADCKRLSGLAPCCRRPARAGPAAQG